jgi:hypothetical protein
MFLYFVAYYSIIVLFARSGFIWMVTVGVGSMGRFRGSILSSASGAVVGKQLMVSESWYFSVGLRVRSCCGE